MGDIEQRKKANADIIKRMKAGEPLQSKSAATWFPPRPIIKKDKNIIKQLYGDTSKIVGENKVDTLEVVKD